MLKSPRLALPFIGVETELASLIQNYDWQDHVLGEPETWPVELKSSLSLMLNSQFPMFISWGEERTFFYNDAYRPILGNKHPRALGEKFHVIWSEIWNDLLPIIENVRSGKSSYFEDLPFTMNRKGVPEQTYFTFSYSPVRDASGDVRGLFCACVETTAAVRDRQESLEREAKLRTMHDVMPQMVWSTFADGYHEYFNQRWYEFTGVPAGSTDGDQWERVIHPEDRERTAVRWQQSVSTGEPYEIEYRLRHHSGEYRWALGRALPVRDESGKIIRWMGTCTDIEDQKRSAIQISESESLLDQIFSESPSFMTLISYPDLKYVRANKAHAALTGVDGVVGKSVREVLPEVESQGFIKILEEIGKSGRPFFGSELAIEFSDPLSRMTRKNFIDLVQLPVRRHDGSIYGIASLGYDVTEQVNARIEIENLARREQLEKRSLEEVLEQTTFPMALLKGPEHIFSFTNSAYNETFGLVKNPVGMTVRAVFPDAEAQGFVALLDDVVKTGKPFIGKEVSFIRNNPDGSTKQFYLDFTYAAKRNPDGEIEGVLAAIFDVTEIIEARNVERALLQDLQVAKEEAERANELKSAFLANMSHEIRTPLGAMMGFADLLKDPGLTATERQSFTNILSRNGESLSVIINDILDLSKVEAGHLTLEYTDTYPDQIGADVISLLRVKANEKDLVLEYAHDESGPKSIVADPTRVRQILLNLVGNAIKFTQFGSVTLKSFTCKSARGRNALCFEIIDTGIGIAESQREKIFEMFVQADGSMTRRFGGTGLGLSLSRHLARAMGGDVVVSKSEEGSGSTFLVTIEDQPEKRVEEDATAVRRTQSYAELPEGSLQGVKVLVVDDAPDNQQLIWRYLTKQGAIVQSAENGMLGYRAALTGDFDIVLMDIQMPIMDGYAATQKLREAGYRKPIIALTAHAMSEVRKKALNVGYSDHLTKPINPKALIGTIVRHVT